jgi:hypothetical protein
MKPDEGQPKQFPTLLSFRPEACQGLDAGALVGGVATRREPGPGVGGLVDPVSGSCCVCVCVCVCVRARARVCAFERKGPWDRLL